MSNLKSIDEIFCLAEEDYISYISKLLNEEDSIYLIDELDDELLNMVDMHPKDVVRICRLNKSIFSRLNQVGGNTRNLAYCFNTLMIGEIAQKNFTQSKTAFLEGIDFCKKNRQYEAGKSISQNIFKIFELSEVPLEEALKFLSKITIFYITLEKHQDAIEALCAAALYFADVSAFQSAYRAINDAQEIAITQKLSEGQIRVLETQGMVALYEGDIDCADDEFQKCFEFYKSINEVPPFQLSANAALVKLRKEDYKSARDIYKVLLNDEQIVSNTFSDYQIHINLLVCSRELGDLSAIEDLLPLIEMELQQKKFEERVEARLVLAKTYYYLNKLQQGTNHLKNSCIEIQSQIDQYHRLHYRRGIREQFVSRIKNLLININDSGIADDILPVLFFCSSNALLDWLSVLDWIDLILKSEIVPISLKERLIKSREELIIYGTPFLYGFREKYDDPFESVNGNFNDILEEKTAKAIDYSLPWQEFNDLTIEICQLYSFPSPFAAASNQNGISLLKKQQLNGSSFLFTFTSKDGCNLVFVAEEKYFRKIIPSENLIKFIKSHYEYQNNQVTKGEFHVALEKFNSQIAPTMNDIMNVLVNSPIAELVFVPDQLTEAFPIIPIILASEHIRAKIRESKFTFRSCHALKEGLTDSIFPGHGIFISNSAESLELVESEKIMLKKTINNIEFFEIDLLHEEANFSKPPIKSAKFIHLASHSVPANIFTDPFFVSTSTDTSKNAIWLESIQRESHNLNLSLVVLNGCNTGTTSNKNYFKTFLTNEKVGLSSAFLLNRRCTVIATQWNEPEVVGYIFSSLFYRRLVNKPNVTQAFLLTIIDLYDLTKKNTIELLEEINDENARQKRCDAINQSSTEYPFRNTYILGMFQYYSLLVSRDVC